MMSSKDDAGISLTWKNLEFSVKVKGKQKRIVKSVSGGLTGGRLVAVLGPSGAGKTSLLNCVAGRTGVTSGTVSLDGRTVNTFSTSYRSRVAYVQQQDIIKITETPEEAIRFSLALRNHSSFCDSKQREAKVNDIISLLGLDKCRGTMFGSPRLKGLSGGEKKRTVSWGLVFLLLFCFFLSFFLSFFLPSFLSFSFPHLQQLTPSLLSLFSNSLTPGHRRGARDQPRDPLPRRADERAGLCQRS